MDFWCFCLKRSKFVLSHTQPLLCFCSRPYKWTNYIKFPLGAFSVNAFNYSLCVRCYVSAIHWRDFCWAWRNSMPNKRTHTSLESIEIECQDILCCASTGWIEWSWVNIFNVTFDLAVFTHSLHTDWINLKFITSFTYICSKSHRSTAHASVWNKASHTHKLSQSKNSIKQSFAEE